MFLDGVDGDSAGEPNNPRDTFSSADARWWYIARPARGAIGAVRLIGRVDYTVSGEEWLPDSNDNQRIILCPKHQSTWETFFASRSRIRWPMSSKESCSSYRLVGDGLLEHDPY